jgi:hypothetical protein
VHCQAHAQQHIAVIGFLGRQAYFGIKPHHQKIVAEFLAEPDEF